MSERFSDEVLQKVLDDNESAYWAVRGPDTYADPDLAKAAGYAAMRKVLEEHENAQIAALEEENAALQADCVFLAREAGRNAMPISDLLVRLRAARREVEDDE